MFKVQFRRIARITKVGIVVLTLRLLKNIPRPKLSAVWNIGKNFRGKSAANLTWILNVVWLQSDRANNARLVLNSCNRGESVHPLKVYCNYQRVSKRNSRMVGSCNAEAEMSRRIHVFPRSQPFSEFSARVSATFRIVNLSRIDRTVRLCFQKHHTYYVCVTFWTFDDFTYKDLSDGGKSKIIYDESWTLRINRGFLCIYRKFWKTCQLHVIRKNIV